MDDTTACHSAPRYVEIGRFAEARAKELAAMSKISNIICSNKRVYQQLPRHMRRRAGGHNVKRLPRRLRKAANREMHKMSSPKITKRPSRRHRRRPSNLLSEYNRRKRKIFWLETHIWHAKRFKMVKKWGCSIPYQSNEKGTRAAYRSMNNHCLIQDLSFYSLIEVCGEESEILKGMQLLVSSQTGTTFAAIDSLRGSSLGHAYLYEPESYPFKPIGPVEFLWQPLSLTDEPIKRILWIWVHPSISSLLWGHMQTVFKSPPEKDLSSESKESEGLLNLNVDTVFININDIEMKMSRHSLQRFRLTGPQSLAILKQSFKLADVSHSLSDRTCWWKSYFNNENNLQINRIQKELWQSLHASEEVPPHTVVSITVGDPRLNLPKTKQKISDSEFFVSNYHKNRQPLWAYSPLWNKDVRDEVSQTKEPEHKLNERRSKMLIPGSTLILGDEESRVPIILVQNPGVSSYHSEPYLHVNPGHSGGWDIIIPSNWGMAFWMSLIYRGARACGLQDEMMCARESSTLYFPDDHLDTQAGDIIREAINKEKHFKHQRVPPAKKPSYYKMGISDPFDIPLNKLIIQWIEKTQNCSKEYRGFYILRGRTELKSVKMIFDCNRNSIKCKQKNKISQEKAINRHTINKTFCRDSAISILLQNYSNAIIAVKVSMILRGLAKHFSLIYIPSKEDLKLLKLNSNYAGPAESVKMVKKQKEKKAEKPSLSFNIEGNDRTIIGFVKSGGYLLSTGSGGGVGYVALLGILELLNSQLDCDIKSPIVLIRSPKSRQYRFAYLQISNSR